MDNRNFVFMFYGLAAAWLIIIGYALWLGLRERRLFKGAGAGPKDGGEVAYGWTPSTTNTSVSLSSTVERYRVPAGMEKQKVDPVPGTDCSNQTRPPYCSTIR